MNTGSREVHNEAHIAGIQGDHVEGSTSIVNQNVENSTSIINNYTYMSKIPLSPSGKLDYGKRCLAGGNPIGARRYFEEAISDGLSSAEVYFHLALAIFSKRSIRDLTTSDRKQLEHIEEQLRDIPENRWSAGLKVVFQLAQPNSRDQPDHQCGLKLFYDLPEDLQAAIQQHLNLTLNSVVTDALWDNRKESAKREQLANDRTGRAWAFFQPEPARPRAKRPARPEMLPSTRTIVWSITAVIVFGFLGARILTQLALWPTLSYLTAAIAAFPALYSGARWKFHIDTIIEQDRIHHGTPRINTAPPNGFTRQVHEHFDYFFAKYHPRNLTVDQWLAKSAGIRLHFGNELADIYREQRIKPGQINWLIRSIAQKTRDRYLSGSLHTYRDKYSPPLKTVSACMVSSSACVVALFFIVTHAIKTLDFASLAATSIIIACSRPVVVGWLHHLADWQTYEDAIRNFRQTLTERTEQYNQWRQRLAALRPSDLEIETWLNADKTMILAHALNVYKLRMSDVIDHSFLLTAERPCQTQREKGGPARHSRYRVLLILISRDGVREFETVLDFNKATYAGEERRNYRFDAISSIDVTKSPDLSHSLSLTLTNGPTRTITVGRTWNAIETPREPPGRDDEQAVRVDLESAGFSHTLHLLEGIAAEGRPWLQHGVERL
jgi:hypothetical protein